VNFQMLGAGEARASPTPLGHLTPLVFLLSSLVSLVSSSSSPRPQTALILSSCLSLFLTNAPRGAESHNDSGQINTPLLAARGPSSILPLPVAARLLVLAVTLPFWFSRLLYVKLESGNEVELIKMVKAHCS
jgi:hypothetical protein